MQLGIVIHSLRKYIYLTAEGTVIMLFKEASTLYQESDNYEELSEGSKRAYGFAFNHLTHFNNYDVRDIKRSDIIKFKEGMSNKKGMARTSIILMSNILSHCMDMDLIIFNPAKGVKVRSKTQHIERWTMEEFKLFCDKAPKEVALFAKIAFFTGQRKVDIINLKWRDYDQGYLRFNQKKTGTILSIPIPTTLQTEMGSRTKVAQSSTHILHNTHGTPWTCEAIRRSFASLSQQHLQVRKTVHGLRKTAASILAESKATPSQIQSITGHRSLNEISLYTRKVSQKEVASQVVGILEEAYYGN